MKKITALLFAVLLVASGCKKSDKKQIAVIPKGSAHLFWQSVHAGSIAASRELNVDILWNATQSEADFAGQLKIVDSMITQHVDAICLAPIDKTAMVSVVERAAKENIPVVIFDSGVDTQNFAAQVTTDNYAGGVAAAERMAKILNGKGNVGVIAVQAGSASTMLREAGFEDTIAKKYPDIKKVDKRYGMSDFATSLGVTENMLIAHPELNGLFASNESSAVGASQALKGRNMHVQLVGFDSSPTLLENLQGGVIDSLVVQDPFRMGYDSVQAAVKKLQGGTPEKIQNIAPLLVTRENLNNEAVQKQLKPDLDKYLK